MVGRYHVMLTLRAGVLTPSCHTDTKDKNAEIQTGNKAMNKPGDVDMRTPKPRYDANPLSLNFHRPQHRTRCARREGHYAVSV